jgi:hypothetical protein
MESQNPPLEAPRNTGRPKNLRPYLRVPTKPAMYSDRKPATLGVNRMGRFDDVVEG